MGVLIWKSLIRLKSWEWWMKSTALHQWGTYIVLIYTRNNQSGGLPYRNGKHTPMLQSTHKVISCSVQFILHWQHTSLPRSTHKVISCSACFILHWQARTIATVYSRGYFLLCVLYTILARTHQCCSLFTRFFLALRALYYTGKDTSTLQYTHKVTSCSACFILHWQGHANVAVYLQGYFLLWLLYTTLAGTHHCHSLLTRLFLALTALYYTGRDTPLPQSTHEVISCSDCFILHWQGHTIATVYSRGYFLLWLLYTTLAGTHHCHSLLTRLFLALTALYYTGRDTPLPQSTHEVISCSDCFILHWQGHTIATVYSRGYFLLCKFYGCCGFLCHVEVQSFGGPHFCCR